MKISLPKALSVSAALLAFTAILTGCGPDQEDQFNSVLSSSDYRTAQVAPHLHAGAYFVSSLPSGGDRHHRHQPRAPQAHHHTTPQAQLGPAAVY